MSKRGPKSAASLSVLNNSTSETLERAEPPEELREDQAVIWRKIINAMPVDWFDSDTHPLLMQYCRHITRSRRLASLIDAEEAKDDMDVIAYNALLRREKEQSTALVALATKMRIAQQATYDKSKRKGVKAKMPWEVKTAA